MKLSGPKALRDRVERERATVICFIGKEPRGLSVELKTAKATKQAKNGDWGIPQGSGVVTGTTTGTPGRLFYRILFYVGPAGFAGIHVRTIRHELAHTFMMVDRVDTETQHNRIKAMERKIAKGAK